MSKILLGVLLMVMLAGCSSMPIKNGELALNANTCATLDDVGVAKIKSQF